MPKLTYLDVAKIDAGAAYPLIEEASANTPEFGLVPASPIAGTSITLTVRSGLPTVGFRGMNEGILPSKSVFETKIFQTMNLDALVEVDRKLVDGALNPARVLDAETVGTMEAAFAKVGSQFYYGDPATDKGFPGLIAQYAADTAHTVDVTGTAAKSSVWMVELGQEKLEFILGNNQTIRLTGWKEETIFDADGKQIPGYKNWLLSSIGCRLANKNSAVRVKNIGVANGKTLTDAHLYAAFAKFKALKRTPTHIFMSHRSHEQLRASRTATTADGNPAPLPMTWNGLIVVPTASIADDEQF